MPYAQFYTLVFLDNHNQILSFIDPTDFDVSKTLVKQNLFQGRSAKEKEYNAFLRLLDSCLVPGGPFYKQNVLWAGSNAMVGDTFLEDRNEKNFYELCNDIDFLTQFKCTGEEFCKMLDWDSKKNYQILSDLTWRSEFDETKYDPDILVKRLSLLSTSEINEFKYLVNHSKKDFILKNGHTTLDNKVEFHPLSVLALDENGESYGDYYGCNAHLAGSWAKDSISLEKDLPSNDFVELKIKFNQFEGDCIKCGTIHHKIENSDYSFSDSNSE